MISSALIKRALSSWLTRLGIVAFCDGTDRAAAALANKQLLFSYDAGIEATADAE
jgi:hypothetical protein